MQLNFLFIAGDMGGNNFLFPVKEKIENYGHRVDYFYGIKLAEYLKRKSTINKRFKVINEKMLGGLFKNGDNSSYDIALISVSRDTTIEKRAIKLAREAEIPVITPIDTWSCFKDRFSDIKEGDLKNKYSYLPDHILVVDKNAKKFAIEDGVPEEKIIITGSPHLEGILKSKFNTVVPERKRLLRNEFGISVKKKVILFISEAFAQYRDENSFDYPGYNQYEVLGDVLKVAKSEIPNAFIILKLHPFEKQFEFKKSELLSTFEHLETLTMKVEDCIEMADIIIGMKSMALIEAVLAGKHVISYQPEAEKEDDFIGNRLDLTQGCYNKEELKKSICCPKIPVREKIAELFKFSEDATDKIVKLVKDIAYG